MEKLTDYTWNEAYSVVEQANGGAEHIRASFSLHRASMGREHGCGASSVRSEYDDVGVMGGGDGEDGR